MPRPSKTWLTTDTHFYHYAMYREWGIRPVNFMELIVSYWKHYIAPQDKMIHLGDVIFYRHKMLKGILDSVPCTKILTMGNHDKKSKTWYSNNGFDLVVDGLTLGNVYFSHHPKEVIPSGCEYNVHGHLHDSPDRPDWYTDHHKLLSLENIGYKPVDLATFI